MRWKVQPISTPRGVRSSVCGVRSSPSNNSACRIPHTAFERVLKWVFVLLLGGGVPLVEAGLEISTDHRSLFFGLMQLSEEKTLAQAGAYHNEVTCSSTNGAMWSLKINLLHPLTSGPETIPLDAFKWQLSWTDGTGTSAGRSEWKPFSLEPELVYISGPAEAAGAPIHFQFSYSLRIPDTQVRGVYQTTIRLTLTEVL